MAKRWTLLLCGALFVGAGLLNVLLFNSSASAINEIFRWRSADEIVMSGGNYADYLVNDGLDDDDPTSNKRPLLFQKTREGQYNANRSLTFKDDYGTTDTCSLFLTIYLDPVRPAGPSSQAPLGYSPGQAKLRVDTNRSGNHPNCGRGVSDYKDLPGNSSPGEFPRIKFDNQQWSGPSATTITARLAAWFGNIDCGNDSTFACRQNIYTSLTTTGRSIALTNPDAYIPGISETCPLGLEECMRQYYLDNSDVEYGDGGTTDENDVARTDPVVCTGGSLGWIFCPLGEFLAGTTSTVAGWVEVLLRVEPLTLNTDNPIFAVWSVVRNLSNIGLILVFLAVIISQITSMGLTNYGIKRILPRLVVAAVAINVSYFICAFAVDIFNLLGAGVEGVFAVGIDATRLQADLQAGQTSATGGQWGAFATAGIALIVLGFYTGLIFYLLPPIVFIALTFFAMFVLLVIRQVLITLLIIVSPIAFLMWLAPGSESFFNFWRRTFITLLMTYPIVMALFAGSALVASIINTTGIASIPGGGTGDDEGVMAAAITGAVSTSVLALPLLSGPIIASAFGSLAQRFGGFINDPNKGLVDRTKKGAQQLAGNSSGGRRWGMLWNARKSMKDRKWGEDYTNADRPIRRAWTRGIGRTVDDALPDKAKPWIPGNKTREVSGRRLDRMASAAVNQEAAELAKILEEAVGGARIRLDNEHSNEMGHAMEKNAAGQSVYSPTGMTAELDKAIKNGDRATAIAAVEHLEKNRAVTQIQQVMEHAMNTTGEEGKLQRRTLHEAISRNSKVGALAPEIAQFAKEDREEMANNKEFRWQLKKDADGNIIEDNRRPIGMDDLVQRAYKGTTAGDLKTARLPSVEKGFLSGTLSPEAAYDAITTPEIANYMKPDVRKELTEDPLYQQAYGHIKEIRKLEGDLQNALIAPDSPTKKAQVDSINASLDTKKEDYKNIRGIIANGRTADERKKQKEAAGF